MSVTRWTGLVPRFERSADSINAFGDAFEAITEVDATNLAHEGIDRSALEPLKVGSIPIIKKELDPYTVPNTASVWTTWNPSGANAFTGNPTCPDGDHLLLEANIVLQSVDGTARGLSSSARIKWRFAWVHNGGLSTTNGTLETGIGNGVNAIPSGRVRPHGPVQLFQLLSQADFTAPLTEVRLEFASTGSVYAARSVMTVTRYRRTF